ncbi:hypothetical protein QFC20_001107 [Naganishia adeliensis]|uniref:Uncharacterized protein n=1 Tax=Naganishia adeliensis TaxID=92952 RepID=A0ACC2WTZ2_9TREE|nr:hypothetical protein QFC20_001107 [Naganishia adeliensis]
MSGALADRPSPNCEGTGLLGFYSRGLWGTEPEPISWPYDVLDPYDSGLIPQTHQRNGPEREAQTGSAQGSYAGEFPPDFGCALDDVSQGELDTSDESSLAEIVGGKSTKTPSTPVFGRPPTYGAPGATAKGVGSLLRDKSSEV